MNHPTKLTDLTTKEIALMATFSSIWIASQVTLGPVVGGLSIGPFSVHGAVNRIVGWALMLILAELASGFGRVSVMAAIAALVTRVIRTSPIEAVTVGAGYAVGGVVFDALFYAPALVPLKRKYHGGYVTVSSLVSGTSAIVPYLLLKLSVLGSSAFLSLVPLYAYSTAKGTILSLAGTVLGSAISSRLRKFRK